MLGQTGRRLGTRVRVTVSARWEVAVATASACSWT
jgi:hypothetical protein